ncbi:MAG: hypothetical protein K2Z81_16280, partial [Cyanobacteria bacterium]|nr:hypothetical protein [Cyanobacteriota bacterium]
MEEMLRLPSSREQVNNQRASDDALFSMRSQILSHREFDQNRSLIRTAVDNISAPSSNESLTRLEETYRRAVEQRRDGDMAGLSQTLREGRQLTRDDRRALTSRNDVCEQTSGFLKTASLFARGRFGLGFAIASHTLDRVNHRDSMGMQLLDAGLGASQALLTKGLFGAFESPRLASMPISMRGVILGSASRLIDQASNRQTYRNPETGSFDLSYGLGSVRSSTLNAEAAVADAVIFSSSHVLLAGTNSFLHGAISRSPVARTMFTGTTFGLSAGAVGEIQRQRRTGEELNIGRVVEQSLIHGALDTVAAAPGGLQLRAEARAARTESPRPLSVSNSDTVQATAEPIADRVAEAPTQGVVAGLSARVLEGVRGIQAQLRTEHQDYVTRRRQHGNDLLEQATALEELGARRGSARTQAEYLAVVNELRQNEGPASGYADAIMKETPPSQEIRCENWGYEPPRIRTFEGADPLLVENYSDRQWRHLFFVDERARTDIEIAGDRGRLSGLQVNASTRPEVGLYPLLLDSVGSFEGGRLTFPTPESGEHIPHVMSERRVESIVQGDGQSS